MKTLDYFTSTIIITGIMFSIISIAKYVFKYFQSDIELTNRRTGKTVKLGRHPEKGLSKKLIDLVN
jgi:hypothetical protein